MRWRRPADGPALLTLSGAIARPNRGALDPALDQLMSKHGLAFDGYTVELGATDLRRLSPIVATHLDGTPLPLGGLGPLWAVHDADRIPELAALPLTERFAQCPWGLYSIHVAAAGGR